MYVHTHAHTHPAHARPCTETPIHPHAYNLLAAAAAAAFVTERTTKTADDDDAHTRTQRMMYICMYDVHDTAVPLRVPKAVKYKIQLVVDRLASGTSFPGQMY